MHVQREFTGPDGRDPPGAQTRDHEPSVRQSAREPDQPPQPGEQDRLPHEPASDRARRKTGRHQHAHLIGALFHAKPEEEPHKQRGRNNQEQTESDEEPAEVRGPR